MRLTSLEPTAAQYLRTGHSTDEAKLSLCRVLVVCRGGFAGRHAAGRSTDLDSMEFGGGWEQPLLCLDTSSHELDRRAEIGRFVGRHAGDHHEHQRTELH